MRPCQLLCSMTTSMQDKALRILTLICTKCLQKQRNKDLEARVEALLNERDVLKGRVQQLKVSPCSDVLALRMFRCSNYPLPESLHLQRPVPFPGQEAKYAGNVVQTAC